MQFRSLGRHILEDALVVDILAKTDLIILDGEDILVGHDNSTKLSILSADQVASGWNSPKMAKLFEWVGSNGLKPLPPPA